MTHFIVRKLEGEELFDVVYRLTSYSFNPTPPLPDRAERREHMLPQDDVIWFAAYEDGAALACAGSRPLIQNVRGTIYHSGGVLGVASHPSGRRKGYARGAINGLLKACHEDGCEFSCLYPFRESFYERMGYVTFPQTRMAVIKPAVLQPLLKKDLGGKVEVLLIGEGYATYREYHLKQQQETHGMALFEKNDELWAQKNPHWLALAKVNGEVVGLMLYELRSVAGQTTLTVSRFFYHTSQGRYLLLEWIARHTDQAAKAELRLPAYEHPESWLDDLQVSYEGAFSPMGRVIDVAKIGGMQTGTGNFSAQISDPLCPWNEGTWQFKSLGGRLKVVPSQRADCQLTIQGLSALVYGTHRVEDFALRGWGSPSPEVQDVMRSMFPPLLPFVDAMF